MNANEEGGKVGYEVSEGARLHFIKFETRQIEKVSAHYLMPIKIAVKSIYVQKRLSAWDITFIPCSVWIM